uniref:Uncharacterized protein n=1 Tax=Avena sativa TaxID=4498 RepID=A0ACD5VMB9_AVESA
MSVVVISMAPPVVVKPSEPVTTTGDINLSSYDKCCVNNPGTALLVFEHPIPGPVETIKKGLSRALVHYYPMAGRLAAGATAGDVVIRCTAEGVSFVAASANCGIKEVQDLWDPSLKEELTVRYPEGLCRYSDPLLLMQVTVFSCGGFVLGVTYNHAVADGVGMGQFLQAVGELSRGLPSPSVVPLRQHDSFSLGPPPVFIKFVEFLASLQPSQMAVLDITVKSSLIKRIRDRYAGAREGYYGNCLLAPLVLATTGAVANGDLMDLVAMIQGAKDRPVPDLSDLEQLVQMPDPYNSMLINSWGNARREGADFGAGSPGRVMGHSLGMAGMPSCTAGFPCNDGYSMLSVCVREDHAGAFLKELADMHHIYPSSRL